MSFSEQRVEGRSTGWARTRRISPNPQGLVHTRREDVRLPNSSRFVHLRQEVEGSGTKPSTGDIDSRSAQADSKGNSGVNGPAVLALADGSIFRGQSIGAQSNTTGEVVFNTALTGYQEILTDPSYARQIVTLTYPHIGNTGCTPEDLESGQIYAAGLVIRDLPPLASSWRKAESLRVPRAGPHRRHRRDRYAQAHPHPAREGRAGGLHHDRRARG
jgi:Carbamoyl-phosphate synthase small chain, CPSase domain